MVDLPNGRLKASDLMVDFLSVAPDTSVNDTLKLIFKNNAQKALVLDDGILDGIVTTYDFMRNIQWGKDDIESMSISDIMTPIVYTVFCEDNIRHVIDMLYHRGVRSVPVLTDGMVAGTVSRKQIAQLFADKYAANYKAKDLMTKRYTTCNVHATLHDLFAKIDAYGDKYIIIQAEDKVAGIVTSTDILKYLYRQPEKNSSSPVKEIMNKCKYTAKKTDKCADIAHIMLEHNVSGVPIVGKRLHGLIRFSCFLQFLDLEL
ncbi:CBS domain-containing protein [Candidatus Altiarchaeota archaeon]